jgi:hypothetical protein
MNIMFEKTRAKLKTRVIRVDSFFLKTFFIITVLFCIYIIASTTNKRECLAVHNNITQSHDNVQRILSIIYYYNIILFDRHVKLRVHVQNN